MRNLKKQINETTTYVNLFGLLIFIFSLIINIPYLIIFKVDDQVIENRTRLLEPDLLKSTINPLKPIAIVYFLKDFFLLTGVCILNIIVVISLKKNLKSKKEKSESTSRTQTTVNIAPDSPNLIVSTPLVTVNKQFKRSFEKKEKNISYMILFLCLVFLVAHLPETVYRLKRKLRILFFTRVNYLDYYLVISNMISFVTSYFKILIYLYFSRTYYLQFKATFLRCRWFSSSEANNGSSVCQQSSFIN